jgi:hypothetical protein
MDVVEREIKGEPFQVCHQCAPRLSEEGGIIHVEEGVSGPPCMVELVRVGDGRVIVTAVGPVECGLGRVWWGGVRDGRGSGGEAVCHPLYKRVKEYQPADDGQGVTLSETTANCEGFGIAEPRDEHRGRGIAVQVICEVDEAFRQAGLAIGQRFRLWADAVIRGFDIREARQQLFVGVGI